VKLPALDALRRAFETAGVDLDRPVVTTCVSGVTASVLAFGLYLLGRESCGLRRIVDRMG
jgi:thiosulfate/3-mercaptopyruvate sulfurtransferase